MTRALRPLLVLGGLAAVWWVLMTGVAHASDGHDHHGLADTLRSTASTRPHVKAGHTPRAHVAPKVRHHAKAAARRTPLHRHHRTEPATQKLATVVSTTPVAPVADEVSTEVARATKATRAATKATKTATNAAVKKVVRNVRESISTTVRPTIAETRQLLQSTVTERLPEAAQTAVEDASGVLESSTLQEETPVQKMSRTTVGSTLTDTPRASTPAPVPAPATSPAASMETDPELVSNSPGAPVDGPLGIPTPQDPCASSSGSGSSSSTPVGVTESSLLVMPAVSSDLHPWRLARLPVGPAYQPGSSPD